MGASGVREERKEDACGDRRTAEDLAYRQASSGFSPRVRRLIFSLHGPRSLHAAARRSAPLLAAKPRGEDPYAALPFRDGFPKAAFFSTSLTRVCHPGPVAL